jgi:hypothetical protein
LDSIRYTGTGFWLTVNLELFRAGSGFAFELFGKHMKKLGGKGDKGLIDGLTGSIMSN